MFSKSCRILLIVCAASTLVACAKPVTSTPKLEQAQINAERAEQQKLLDQQQGKKAPEIKLQSAATVKRRVEKIAPRIQKAGTEVCQTMWGTKANCSFKFSIANDDALNAWADGKGVYITPKMVSFAALDEELANVLAHEYAHNILKHPQSTGQNATAGAIGGMLLDVLAQSQGLNTGGQLSQLGGNYGQFHYSIDFEKEADYVGLYILSRAGYEPNGARDFWRKFTIQNPGGLYGNGRSHPSNPERTLAMQKTSGEIQAKRFAKKPLLPNLRND